MTRRTRRNHSPALRPRWRVAAIQGGQTLAELAQQVVCTSERDQAVEGAPAGRQTRDFRRWGEEGGHAWRR